MATKILSAKPGGKIRRRIVKKSIDQKIAEARKALGLNPKWENLKLQISMLQS